MALKKISSSYESEYLIPKAPERNVNFPVHNHSFYRLAPIMISCPFGTHWKNLVHFHVHSLFTKGKLRTLQFFGARYSHAYPLYIYNYYWKTFKGASWRCLYVSPNRACRGEYPHQHKQTHQYNYRTLIQSYKLNKSQNGSLTSEACYSLNHMNNR